MCVFWQHGGRRCLGKDFPRAVSRSSVCSHRGRVHMLTVRTHMVSFPCVVATCGPERARNYEDRKTNTHRRKCRGMFVENTQQASNLTTFLPLPQGSQRASLHLERGLQEAFHACTVLLISLTILMISCRRSLLLWENKGELKREEDKTGREKKE